jgi:hypothetical protein
MIRKQVEKGQMPPWFSAPLPGEVHGKWANDRTMPEEDRKDLLAWLAGDRAEGNRAEAPLPVRRETEWAIGKPDAVYAIPTPVKIPAEGVMAYEYAFIDTDQTQERWIQSLEIRPTVAAAVHHVLVWVVPPGGKKGRGEATADEISGFFAAYVPGNSHRVFPEGFGKALPAGATLKFQIHYTPFDPDPALLARIDILVMSIEDVHGDQSVAERYAQHCGIVALTRGANGADIYLAGVPHHINAYPAVERDPTGAGDVFAAALMVRYAETRNAIDAAQFAAVVAAASVEGLGISTIPDRTTIETRLSNYTA